MHLGSEIVFAEICQIWGTIAAFVKFEVKFSGFLK